MHFTLVELKNYVCARRPLSRNVLPLEADEENFSEHENIPLALARAGAGGAEKNRIVVAAGAQEFGGMALVRVLPGGDLTQEVAARSVFGPLAMNCSAPNDGNMLLLARVGTPAQQEWWLRPVVEGKVKSSFAMTEPAPGGGSDPSMIRTTAEKQNGKWVISGRKWFITGAAEAAHFIVVARTSDDPRRGLTAFLYHRDQPGWRIVRRIPIMGPEEHGGHCELEFDGLEVGDENVLSGVGDGLKITQIRLGPARLTHCMRWLGLSKRCVEIAQEYVNRREGFGIKLADRESVQIKLGEVAQQIQIGRLLTMQAAWKLDQGDRARKEISMAKVHVADTLHQASDTALQLNGARGYSKDTVLEWIYRSARAARLIDGASEVHNMVLARFLREEGHRYSGAGARATEWQRTADRSGRQFGEQRVVAGIDDAGKLRAACAAIEAVALEAAAVETRLGAAQKHQRGVTPRAEMVRDVLGLSRAARMFRLVRMVQKPRRDIAGGRP